MARTLGVGKLRRIHRLTLPAMLTLAAVSLGRTDSQPADPDALEDARTTTRVVFDRLTANSGTSRIPPPLVVSPGTPRTSDGQVATGKLAFYQKGGAITISQFVYDECRKVAGDKGTPDCLAALIGHELAHFYLDHSWATDVGPLRPGTLRDAGLPNGATQEQADLLRRYQEAQADHYSGVYGFQAGYNPTKYGEAVLDRIYTDITSLQTATNAYPDLKDRKNIMADSYNYLKHRLYPAFEAGVQLFVLGRYPVAAACFDFISETFVSREVLSNAAASYVLAAIDADPSLSGGYVYPVQLDLDTPLNPGQSHRAISGYLEKAEARSRLALALDPRYPAALVNSAIALSIAETPAEALADKKVQTLLDDASRAGGEAATKVALLRGILLARAGNKEEAKQRFRGLRGNRMAEANLRIAAGEKAEQVVPAQIAVSAFEERIGEFNLPAIAAFGQSMPPFDLYLPATRLEDPIQLWASVDKSEYRWYGVRSNRVLEASMATTTATYEGAFLGKYHAGSDISEILRDRKAVRSFAALQGKYYVLTNPALLIFTSNAGKVVSWTLYTTTGMKGN